MVRFDYISDLHIDYWDENYFTKKNLRLGQVKDFPLDWEDTPRNDMLIIAGDISDDINLSVRYIKKLKTYYKTILFVDGNHEHYKRYPKLYTTEEIYKKLKGIEGVYYLPHDEYIIEGIVFIGYCGWWNFNSGEIDKNLSTRFTKKQSELLNKNIYLRSQEEFKLLKSKVDKYEKSKKIKEIIIITHTVALPRFVRESAVDFNNKFIIFNKGNYKKIRKWVFGHNHHGFRFTGFGIRYLSNPRGRPEDYDREEYTIKSSN
jgi:DNA repair exonuclease SbcCD nuclease subunit